MFKAYHWSSIKNMKEIKIQKWQKELNQVSKDRREGRISSAVALTLTMILVRDIRIFQGLEKCYY